MSTSDSQTTVRDGWDAHAPEAFTRSLEGDGRYAVLEEVGRGGMGRVVRAYDPALQREVALKEVHQAALDPASKARMVSEARAMAKLSHPNVVGVYDVEADEAAGGIRIVMEFVEGTTLRTWIQGERSVDEILAIFVQAGRGLAAAHRKGLVHRDFKPANVLVGPGDSPVVKVTDFGIAKGMGEHGAQHGETDANRPGPGASSTTLTQAGTVVGTPRYMAPEQHAGKELTPAADQFAFCVALWEALTGEPPYAGDTIAKAKFKGPPPWRTVARAASDDKDIASNRAIGAAVPKRVVAALERGLSPKPADRWPDMDALLGELAPGDRTARRNALIGLALVATVAGGALWATARAQPEQCTGARSQLEGVWDDARAAQVDAAINGIGRPYAASTADRARAQLDAYAHAWAETHTQSCLATSRGEQSSTVLDLRMSCLARARLGLGATVDVLATADDEVVARADKLLDELPKLARCSDVEGLLNQADPPADEDAQTVEATRPLLARSNALLHAGLYEDALESVEATQATFGDVDYPPVEAEIVYVRGAIEHRLGQFEESIASFERAQRLAVLGKRPRILGLAIVREAFALSTNLQRPDEAERLMPILGALAVQYPETLETHYHVSLGGIRAAQGRLDEAVVHYADAVESVERLEGPDSLAAAMNHGNLGMAHRRVGKLDEAEAELRTSLAAKKALLGPGHPHNANTLQALGTVLMARDRYDEAEELYQQSYDLRRETLPADHPELSHSLNALGVLYKTRGDYDKAETVMRQAIDVAERAFGKGHAHVATMYNNLANVLRRTGDLEQAETLYRKALEIQLESVGEMHPSTADSYNNLGVILRAQGRLEESESIQRKALAIKREVRGKGHPATADSHTNLGNLLLQMGRLDEAREQHELGLAIRLEANEPSRLARSRADFARVALAQHDVALALQLTADAWAFFAENDDANPEDAAECALVRAQALWEAGERDEADEIIDRATQLATAAGKAGVDWLEQIETWRRER